jgi:alpha-L-fucosidase
MRMNRREFLALGAAGVVARGFPRWRGPHSGGRPRPSAAQLSWQRDELAMFLHFGVNTFTDREWGDGHEDPAVFAPARLDARQWARTAKAAGFRAMILTAKHHDGFCLWPTRTTRHSVAASAWRGGQGDVVRDFVEACRAEGLRAGLYLSPWDRNAPVYGDSPRYNDFYCDQLTELLTRYGPISEVWFDGANGEGPNGRRQAYDWPRIWGTVRRLQPNAVMFSDAGPDVRWIGNERGVAAETNWSTVDPAVVPYPGASGDAVLQMLQHGDPSGSVWRPGETDVSIRPGWFYHAAENARVKTVDELAAIYFTSVGRNSKLLLNVPPTRDGVLDDTDVARLGELRRHLDTVFATNIAGGRPVAWRTAGRQRAVATVDLGAPTRVSIADLREEVSAGQVIARYAIEGEIDGTWRPITRGTTVGFRKLDRFEPVTVRQVRVVIEDAVGDVKPLRVGLYA